MHTILTTNPDNGLLELVSEIIKNQHVYTNLTLLLGALLTYATVRINIMKARQELEYKNTEEMIKSTKRVALRTEYLQIINSRVFTNLQKYQMTRYIIEDYNKLNGNHYIHGLDEELKLRSEERPHEIE